MEISTFATIGLVILLLRVLYRYVTEPYKYWESRGIPSVPAIPLVGSLIPVFLRPMQFVFRERYEKYGRLHGQYEGIKPTITVADPELLRNIFVKDFQFFPNRRDFTTGDKIFDNIISVVRGEKWKRIRTIMTPAFTTGKIKKMSSMFLDAAKTLAKSVDSEINAGKAIDCKRHYGAFTMDVIASTAFGTKLDSSNDPDNPFVAHARSVFTRNMPWRFILFFICPGLFKALKLSVFSPAPMEFFKSATLEIIKERRRTGKVANDFLQLMMDSAEEALGKDGINIVNEEEEEFETVFEERNGVATSGEQQENGQMFKITNLKGLDYDEMLAQCIIFFLAGYDTTASTLSFVNYNLALNPSYQETLFEEIDDVLRKNNNELTYEGVQSMKFLDMVICETLRMFPPAVGLERQAEADYKLGDTGITITKDMIVVIPSYAMHYDPEYYPDPEKFDPYRFTAEENAKRKPYTYLPFGYGPRNCLGMRFALMEIKFCLAHIFSQFRVKRCAQTKVPLEYYLGQGLLQPKEIIVQFERRTDKVAS